MYERASDDTTVSLEQGSTFARGNKAFFDNDFCGEGACSRSTAKQAQTSRIGGWGRFAAQREQAPSPQGYRHGTLSVPAEGNAHAQDPRGSQLPLDQQTGDSAGPAEPDHRPQWQRQVQSLPRLAPVGGDRSGWRGECPGPRRRAGFDVLGRPGNHQPPHAQRRSGGRADGASRRQTAAPGFCRGRFQLRDRPRFAGTEPFVLLPRPGDQERMHLGRLAVSPGQPAGGPPRPDDPRPRRAQLGRAGAAHSELRQPVRSGRQSAQFAGSVSDARIHPPLALLRSLSQRRRRPGAPTAAGHPHARVAPRRSRSGGSVADHH